MNMNNMSHTSEQGIFIVKIGPQQWNVTKVQSNYVKLLTLKCCWKERCNNMWTKI